MSAETQSQLKRRASEYDSIVSMGLDVFWQQENACIHQALAALMGNLRFVVQAGEIVGIGMRKLRQGSSTRRRRHSR